MAALESAAKIFLDRSSPQRADTIDAMAAENNFSRPMIERAIDWTFGEITVNAMRRLLISELDGDDTPSDPAFGSPRLTAVIAAGAIFQPAVNCVVHALLVKSPVFVKCSSHDRVLLPAFLKVLARIDPEVGGAARAESWPGATDPRTAELLSAAGAVIAFGTDETIAAIRPVVPEGTPLIAQGHKISLACVGAGALKNRETAAAAAAALALDTAMYDQTGCLSPHAVYVESGAPVDADGFSVLLAHELGQIAKTLPPGPIANQTAADVQAYRGNADFRSCSNPNVRCLFGDRLDYTVILDDEPVMHLSPLGRTIAVHPIGDIRRLPEHLAPFHGKLQAVGAAPDEPILHAIHADLQNMGASYFCPLGRMQRPPLNWKNTKLFLRG